MALLDVLFLRGVGVQKVKAVCNVSVNSVNRVVFKSVLTGHCRSVFLVLGREKERETNEHALTTGYFPIWQANAMMSPAIQFAANRPGQNIVRPCSWCSLKADKVVLLALMHTWSPC